MTYSEDNYVIDDEVIDIVSTPGALGGAPRLDGHRIAVYHILSHYRTGSSVEEIVGDEVYPQLREAQVRAALHYAIDYPDAVEQSSQPRETPLMLVTSYNTQVGGVVLSVLDMDSDESGTIADATISADDLSDRYSDQDLHAAWSWMYESRVRDDESHVRHMEDARVRSNAPEEG